MAATSLLAASAHAATKMITFDIAADAWTQSAGTEFPFNTLGNTAIHGYFTYDDSTWTDAGVDGVLFRDITYVSISAGPVLINLTPLRLDAQSYVEALTPGDDPYYWALVFKEPTGPGPTDFSFFTSDTANITDGTNEVFCKRCVTSSVSVVPGGGVPEPATWAMMIAGFGLAGATLRRRTYATRFQP